MAQTQTLIPLSTQALDNILQVSICLGRVQIVYSYGCYGYTRSGGSTWHGGLDLVCLDDTTIRMPYYTAADGTRRAIKGTVVTARIVTDHTNLTWEWGYYVCVRLDDAQTPDEVNYLYFCHCSKLLVKAGDRVSSSDALAVMGQTGNAAGGYDHCHFEVRATATGIGLDPTAYAGVPNAVGTYGSADAAADEPMQAPTIGPMSLGDYNRIMNQAAALGKGAALYTVQFEAMTTQTAAQLQATAKELDVQYKSDWVKG